MELRKNLANQKFAPLELNEQNVHYIFKTCLAKEEDEDKDSYKLFRKEKGFESTSAAVFFSQKRLSDHFKSILYLCGQIESIHSNKYVLSPTDVAKTYTGKFWTKNSGNVAALLLLAFASGLCAHFEKENGVVSAPFLKIITPTLSPKDPGFPAWWESHETKWEDKPRSS